MPSAAAKPRRKESGMFESITNFAELRKAYHAASRKAHPDMGGTNEEMQRVNADYERATKRIERMGDYTTDSENSHKTTAADMEAYAEILQKLFAMDGIEVELCGSWLWITGNTFAFRSELKEAGCKWSKSKQAWYWYSGEYHRRCKRGYSLEEIRDLHGSETIRGAKPRKLAAT